MLREQVYEAMTERSKKSTYEYRQYIKVAPDTAKAKPAPLPMPAGAFMPEYVPAFTTADAEAEEQAAAELAV